MNKRLVKSVDAYSLSDVAARSRMRRVKMILSLGRSSGDHRTN